MESAFKDKMHDPQEMAARAQTYGVSFSNQIKNSDNPSKFVLYFCETIRTACSSNGKKAREKFNTSSRDFLKVAEWLKGMTRWLTLAEAAEKNLKLDPRSMTDMATAAQNMGLLFCFHQSLEYVVD